MTAEMSVVNSQAEEFIGDLPRLKILRYEAGDNGPPTQGGPVNDAFLAAYRIAARVTCQALDEWDDEGGAMSLLTAARREYEAAMEGWLAPLGEGDGEGASDHAIIAARARGRVQAIEQAFDAWCRLRDEEMQPQAILASVLCPWLAHLDTFDAAEPPDGPMEVPAFRHQRRLERLRQQRTRQQTESIPQRQPEPPRPVVAQPRFAWIDSGTFASTEYPLTWIVKRMLVQRQPCVIGGPKKGLKTSTLVDLAVSLGTATPFLNYFDVYRPMRVGVMSGESGEATLKETALRVCATKRVRLEDADVLWGFRLPQLARPADLVALRETIVASGIEVLVIDPLYLSLLSGVDGGQASNLYQMGPLLLAVAETCLAVGCTPILAHHFRLTRPNPHEPPGLEDLAFAGIQEFARQWILLGRRERYEEGSGEHKLWLSVGGSAGQSGLWTLDVAEGLVGENFAGRRWDVTVTPASDARRADDARRDEVKRDRAEQRQLGDEAEVLRVVDEQCSGGEAPTLTVVRDLCNISKDRARAAVSRLLHRGVIEELSIVKAAGNGAKQKHTGLRRAASVQL